MKTIRYTCFIPALLIAFMGITHVGQAQSFSEPHTVFYGKVLGTAGAQDFLITTGRLSWTFQRSDGAMVTLETSLFPLHNNTYSYRLDVPHAAFALGLDPGLGGIPLPPIPQVHVHASVSVNGQNAELLGPAGVAFTTEQLLRTATYRMDLGVDRAPLDSDGDGIPDWWEDLYGLDKQNPGDALSDSNGDGISALQAYVQGLNPNQNAREPTLLTKEMIIYPSGSTAILLDVFDTDSTPTQLVYTVTSLPENGVLSVRNAVSNPNQPDAALSVGAMFTQADLLNGRIIYDHDGDGNDAGSFGVVLRDQTPVHSAATGTISLLVYEPATLVPDVVSDTEMKRIEHHYYAGQGYVILDGSVLNAPATLSAPSALLSGSSLVTYQNSYGDDRSYVLTSASSTNSIVRGGHRNDVVLAGAKDGTLTGGLGGDWFVFRSFSGGLVNVTDFNPAENDVLDLSRIPAASGAFAHQYIRIVKTGAFHRIQTDLDGNGSGFTNLAVQLAGLTDQQAELYTLVESGNLLIGSLALEPMISVSASQSQASENSGSSGTYTLTRRGSLVGDLTVNVVMSGSAQNGLDYMLVPSTITMPAGVASVDIPVTPFTDGVAEPTETVVLTVLAGSGYRVGSVNQAVVTIEDLLMLVEIEAIESIAVKDGLTPGVMMITRRDVINRDVVIRLTIGGTAANGVDYNTLSTIVYMAPNQTVAFLNITPRLSAVLAGGLETVLVTVRPDANYRVSGVGNAQVSIIERYDSFAGWRAREFPASTGDVSTFAQTDSGLLGATHFERYAFGLNPQQPGSSGMPTAFIYDDHLVVTFRKPLGVTDVQYRIAASSDLMNWTDQTLNAVQIPAPDGTSVPDQVYYRIDETPSSAFLVIEAELLP
jgi:hypothetical protein